MAIQIANPAVIAKVERLARSAGLGKTAAVERAVDRMLADAFQPPEADVADRFGAILAQIDRLPDLSGGQDPLPWDEGGLPA